MTNYFVNAQGPETLGISMAKHLKFFVEQTHNSNKISTCTHFFCMVVGYLGFLLLLLLLFRNQMQKQYGSWYILF